MSGELRTADVALLRALAKRGAMHRKVHVTSGELADELGSSQQGASACLIRLSKRGLIERSLTARGQLVRLAQPGIAVLRADYAVYKQLFEAEASVDVAGTVATGLGEGGYYLSKPGYKAAMSKMLGSEPFPGTLNVRLQGEHLEFMNSLRGMGGVEIPGFEDGGRTFGPIKCFKAEIGSARALVVIPARTHYTDIMEIVAAVHLRTKLGLSEGKTIIVRVFL